MKYEKIILLKADGNHKAGKTILVDTATADRKVKAKTAERPAKPKKKVKKTEKKETK